MGDGVTVSALAYSATAAEPEATKVAQSVIDQYVSAYNKHDPKAIAMLFVPNGVFLPASGAPLVQGRDEIERSWTDLFKNMGGQETITIKDAIPAGNDAVVAVTEFKIVGDGPNAGKTISGRAAITLTKTPEGWRYVSIAPQTPPPPAAGTTGSRQ
jgi:uncharacterized protein (TIGR02246 family)